MRRWRNLLLYRAPAAVAALTASLLPKLPSEAHRWLAVTRLSRTARILDVGSGVGFLVRDLGEAGYTSVVGIDPYIDMPVRYPSGAHVMRQTIHETTGPFDLIMFHHSLEHIPDQVETLRRACELLAPGGWCLVRVPVASSHAWRHYREHWVQLDAPRHYALHTVESLRRAGARAGLTLVRVEHDSTELQFWGSEAYRRNVPLTEAPSLFTRAQMRGFRRRARALNRIGEGDQACFYFQARGAGSATGDSHPTRSDPR